MISGEHAGHHRCVAESRSTTALVQWGYRTGAGERIVALAVPLSACVMPPGGTASIRHYPRGALLQDTPRRMWNVCCH